MARLVDDVFVVLGAYKIDHCILAAESASALTALGAALRLPGGRHRPAAHACFG